MLQIIIEDNVVKEEVVDREIFDDSLKNADSEETSFHEQKLFECEKSPNYVNVDDSSSTPNEPQASIFYVIIY